MVSQDEVLDVLRRNEALAARLDTLGPDDNLFDRGLDSFGSVQLMLALEDRFGVEFPDALLNRKSFSTLRDIRETVGSLLRPQAA